MRVVVRGNTWSLRGVTSSTFSACVHGAILGWVALGPSLPLEERPRSIYDQQIRPNEKKIVWYNLRDKLPEVAPGARSDPRPARARVKFHQTVVSGARDDSRPPQMIWSPEPAIEVPKPDAARLPNVLAVAPPARPQPRPFAVPPENRPKSAAAQLAEAPAMAAKPELRNLPLTTAGPRPQPLAFTLPPAIKRDRPATLVLPDAPVLEAAVKITGAPDLPLTAPMPRLQPKVFNAPPVRPLTEIAGSSRSGSADMDAPPATENRPLSAPGAIAGLARPFLAPPSAPRIERPPAALPAEAPAAGAASSQTASLASMAIVGLNPANTSVIPAPPAPRDGGFSAGPVVRPEG